MLFQFNNPNYIQTAMLLLGERRSLGVPQFKVLYGLRHWFYPTKKAFLPVYGIGTSSTLEGIWIGTDL